MPETKQTQSTGKGWYTLNKTFIRTDILFLKWDGQGQNTIFAKWNSTRKKKTKNKLHHKKDYKKLDLKNLSVFNYTTLQQKLKKIEKKWYN